MPTPKQHESNADRQRAYRARLATASKPEKMPKPKPIPSKPGKARWTRLQAQAVTALETIRDEMQETYDERSESWQESERGEELQAAIEAVEAAIEAVEAAIEF